jgi:hypothetical protein
VRNITVLQDIVVGFLLGAGAHFRPVDATAIIAIFGDGLEAQLVASNVLVELQELGWVKLSRPDAPMIQLQPIGARRAVRVLQDLSNELVVDDLASGLMPPTPGQDPEGDAL